MEVDDFYFEWNGEFNVIGVKVLVLIFLVFY